MEIRRLGDNDLDRLLELYAHLHEEHRPKAGLSAQAVWADILRDVRQHVLGGFCGGALVCSCVVVVVPNLTHGHRPYALLENVVTHKQHRNKGYASQLLDFAKRLAIQKNCYKLMLLTGSKQESVLRFYEKAGYNRQDKTGFVQWI